MTEAEVEALARRLAAEAGWKRYVDTVRRALEAAPAGEGSTVTNTLPAEAIEAATEAAASSMHTPEFDEADADGNDRVDIMVRAALLAALPYIRGAASPSPTSVPDGQEAVVYSLDIDGLARGSHIGLWPDRASAERTRDDYFNSVVTPLYLHPAPSDMEGVAEANEDQIKHIMLIRLTHTNAKTY